MIHFTICCLLTVLLVGAAELPRPQLDPTPLGIPFQRYTSKDSLGRTITAYLSVLPKDEQDAPRPVALLIQGSGCQSLFRKQGEQITGGYPNALLGEARGRVRVLVQADRHPCKSR